MDSPSTTLKKILNSINSPTDDHTDIIMMFNIEDLEIHLKVKDVYLDNGKIYLTPEVGRQSVNKKDNFIYGRNY